MYNMFFASKSKGRSGALKYFSESCPTIHLPPADLDVLLWYIYSVEFKLCTGARGAW